MGDFPHATPAQAKNGGGDLGVVCHFGGMTPQEQAAVRDFLARFEKTPLEYKGDTLCEAVGFAKVQGGTTTYGGKPSAWDMDFAIGGKGSLTTDSFGNVLPPEEALPYIEDRIRGAAGRLPPTLLFQAFDAIPDDELAGGAPIMAGVQWDGERRVIGNSCAWNMQKIDAARAAVRQSCADGKLYSLSSSLSLDGFNTDEQAVIDGKDIIQLPRAKNRGEIQFFEFPEFPSERRISDDLLAKDYVFHEDAAKFLLTECGHPYLLQIHKSAEFNRIEIRWTAYFGCMAINPAGVARVLNKVSVA